METSVKFSVALKDKMGTAYNGDFVVKVLLSRRDIIRADEIRREIVGASPSGTPPAPSIQAEAIMMSQLAVRILEAPEWWLDSDLGRNFIDDSIVKELFNLAGQKEDEFLANLEKKAKGAAEELKKPKG